MLNFFSLKPSISPKFHQISRGKSPFVTEHVVDTASFKLNSSSPKSNGIICGMTFLEKRVHIYYLLMAFEQIAKFLIVGKKNDYYNIDYINH